MITGYSKEPKSVPLLNGKFVLAYDAFCKCPICGAEFVRPNCIPEEGNTSREAMVKLLSDARCDDCVQRMREQEQRDKEEHDAIVKKKLAWMTKEFAEAEKEQDEAEQAETQATVDF